MPRPTRCPVVQQDAQTNKMPRCPARCPDQQDAQTNKMPSCPARCPVVQLDAQMSSEMPRCHDK